ncbi:nucleotidyltransferase family protein [Gluconobacter morbifer]|uniref:MobA-like NTP transferase domain-containing protein n=1 Tax=Gluconobacter morbifer G707 TaxID=1088869 RepID=G6XLT9_9PROT|nr:nucleotidyltransferase family protein [Gluconobacter morbifer]EHH67344.1 hypothetical protein GMO_23380 [Gluconobacter morbifer G707]
MSAHTAILLAAGGSRRLGQPKQLLTIQGVPLVRHMAQLLLATQPEELVVVTGGARQAVEDALAGLNVVRVHNPLWENGLSTSLQTAAHSMGPLSLPTLISATDQPALTVDHLLNLLKTGHQTETDILTRYSEDAVGIPACLLPSTLQKVDQLKGDQGFRKILGRQTETLYNPALEQDIDTPESLLLARNYGNID